MSSTRPNAGRTRLSRAFTLIEVLIVVALLGIASAILLPTIGSVNVLQIQGAVRTVVTDLTFAQNDAIAYQERRAVMFDVASSSYRLVAVPGNVIDPETNILYNRTSPNGLYEVSFFQQNFGDSRITRAEFNNDEDDNTIIFDSLGGPVADPGGNTPGAGGIIEIRDAEQSFEIRVEPFTGRINVTRTRGG